jgi:hypothetical protein
MKGGVIRGSVICRPSADNLEELIDEGDGVGMTVKRNIRHPLYSSKQL